MIIIPGEILEFLYINITGLCTTYRWTYCTYCTHCNAIEMVELRIGPDTFLGNIPSDGIFHLTPESGMSTNFLFCWTCNKSVVRITWLYGILKYLFFFFVTELRSLCPDVEGPDLGIFSILHYWRSNIQTNISRFNAMECVFSISFFSSCCFKR